jgi:hypothetical protein
VVFGTISNVSASTAFLQYREREKIVIKRDTVNSDSNCQQEDIQV